MHSDKLKEIERLALKEFEEPHLHKLYTAEFKLEFIPTHIPDFIEELYRQCEKAGILKKRLDTDPQEDAIGDFSPNHIKDLVAEAKTKEAMLHLKVFLNRRRPHTQKSFNELIVLRNRYNLLRQREQRGTIYPGDLVVENNQIVEQLLNLITKAQNL